MVSQTVELVDATACELEQHRRECIAHEEDMYGMMERTLDQVITLIDEGLFSREDEDSGELLSITPGSIIYGSPSWLDWS